MLRSICVATIALALTVCATSVFGETLFFDDFSDGDARDGVPVTWNDVPSSIRQDTSIDVEGGDLKISNWRAAGAVPEDLVLDDASIRTQVRLTQGYWIGVVARFDLSQHVNSYWGGISPDGTASAGPGGGGWSTEILVPTDFDVVNEDVVLQLDVIGDTVSFWAWSPDGPLPSEPLGTFTDTRAVSGTLGLAVDGEQETVAGMFRYTQVADSHIPITDPSPEDSEITIVVPPEYDTMEGPGRATDQVVQEGTSRSQNVVPSEFFASLPDTHRWLTGIRLRPDASVTSPVTVEDSYAVVRASTTSRGPSELSLTFTDNIGSDETIVHDGAINYSTANTGPPDGPKDFDVEVSFQKPFFFDPRQGNLLMDWTISEPLAHPAGDSSGGDSRIGFVYADDPASPVADYHTLGGAIEQYVFVPLSSTGLKAGDADQDFDFDQVDVVRILQAAKYLSGQPATWGEGDFTEDGVFDQFDIIAALGTGNYLAGPYAARPAPIPEPSTATLLLLALAGTLAATRWKIPRM